MFTYINEGKDKKYFTEHICMGVWNKMNKKGF